MSKSNFKKNRDAAKNYFLLMLLAFPLLLSACVAPSGKATDTASASASASATATAGDTTTPSTPVQDPIAPSSNCVFNNQSVAHGASVTAFQAATVAYGGQCVSQSRLCSNGVLSGSFSHASCAVTATAATRCLIQTSECANSSYSSILPQLINGSFADTYNGSHLNKRICLQRAADFYSACGSKKAVTAKYLENQNILGTKTVSPPNPWNIRVGAIRWDGWTGDAFAGRKVTESLRPSQFWLRLPFFGKIVNGILQYIDGNKQSVMDQEIVYASRAGLDYWAFVEYPPDSGVDDLAVALNLYLASANQSMNFSLIMGVTGYARAVNESTRASWISAQIAKLLDPRYETVQNGRPVVYVFDDICSATYRAHYCSPWYFEQLSAGVFAAKNVKPYYVYLSWYSGTSAGDAKYLGMDAISTYAMGPGSIGMPVSPTPLYMNFANKIRNEFEDSMRNVALSAGLEVVPFATAGWDPSPRLACGSNCWGDSYPQGMAVSTVGTGAEVALHVRSVAEWAAYHRVPRSGATRATSPAGTMLIYAWNEFDEGGWLAPTLSADRVNPDTQRIDALRLTLRP